MTMQTATVAYDVRVAIWAEPAEGVTLDALVAELRALGNQVLAVDTVNCRVLIVCTDEGS